MTDTPGFNLNAILRGMQLTLVGAYRSLQNPALFTNAHYRQATCAVLAGASIKIIIATTIAAIKLLFTTCSSLSTLEPPWWNDHIVSSLDFVSDHIMQFPLFLMTLMGQVTPTLDDLFMESLQWVDKTYVNIHKFDRYKPICHSYHSNLEQYDQYRYSLPKRYDRPTVLRAITRMLPFFRRFARKGFTSLILYSLSYLPIVGGLILPIASFYAFKKAAGFSLAIIVFSAGICLPRRYLAVFLQTYFASRSLMRELLEPYLRRICFPEAEKKRWFRSRQGILFGFGLGFYGLMRVPLAGVLVYGIAEASTAYLITKITDPPPPPAHVNDYIATQQTWTDNHELSQLL